MPSVTPIDRELDALISEFAGRYANPGSSVKAVKTIHRLFLHAGKRHPDQLTEADIVGFCTAGQAANNTVYQRLSWAGTFLTWCYGNGYAATNPAAAIRDRSHPLRRSYKRTYGRVQSATPGRWLTHREAYEELVPVTQDGTLRGVRDEIILRLGLLGVRAGEIRALNLGHLRSLPHIEWTGKGNRPRRVTAGPALQAALARWLAAYDNPSEGSPLVCRFRLAGFDPQMVTRNPHAQIGRHEVVYWGQPIGQHGALKVVRRRAAEAGLGHVATHDLRRTAAGILHRAVTDDGAHHFDLLDIQRVLGHADPATTMRSYLEPIDTAVIDRAATYLD